MKQKPSNDFEARWREQMKCDCEELISDVKDLSKGTCKNCGKKFQLVKNAPRGFQGIAWEEIEDEHKPVEGEK